MSDLAIRAVKTATLSLVLYYAKEMDKTPILDWLKEFSAFCHGDSIHGDRIGNSFLLIRKENPKIDEEGLIMDALDRLNNMLSFYIGYCFCGPRSRYTDRFLARAKTYSYITRCLLAKDDYEKSLSYWENLIDRMEQNLKEHADIIVEPVSSGEDDDLPEWLKTGPRYRFTSDEQFFIEFFLDVREHLRELGKRSALSFLRCCATRKELNKIVRYLKPVIYKKV